MRSRNSPASTTCRKRSSASFPRATASASALAEALVAEPDLLILDEPTIGLDPNQIRQVRDLIKNLGKKHTILLSTHILPEVEMTCSRVIILHKGKIEASDTPANLLSTLRSVGNIRLEASTGKDDGHGTTQKGARHQGGHAGNGCRPSARRPLPRTRPPTATTPRGPLTATVVSCCAWKPGRTPARRLFRLAVDRKWTLRELARRRATLEDVFVEITHAE